jgi:uncharacterized protein YjcR
MTRPGALADEHGQVGAKYGVSDNAVRKWLSWHGADIAKQVGEALAAGGERKIRI